MQPLDAERVPLSGTTVIEASAGTGKTYTITSLFLRLILERGLTVGQILVVTYTRAATAELRQRIRMRLGEALRVVQGSRVDDALVVTLCVRFQERHGETALRETVERAMASLDEAPVFTIHGFGQRALNEHAFESGSRMNLELTTCTAPILAEIADDYFTRQLYDASPLGARALLQEPDKLRTLAARTASSEGLRVLPEHTDVTAFDADAWRAAHARCVQLWLEDREAVVSLIASSDKGARFVDSWARQWDSALKIKAPGCTNVCSSTGRAAFTRAGAQERTRKGRPSPSHLFLDAADVLVALEDAYDQLFDDEKLRFRRHFIDFLQHELEQRSRSSEARTFDALLTELDRALRGPQSATLIGALRQRYGAALVDEFQDTDPLQYRIFRSIFGDAEAPLFLIGDPKQAIYGFRGADVHAYLAARANAGDRVYTLDTNRRSDPALIEALNSFYAQVTRPFALDEIAYQAVKAPTSASDRLHPDDGHGAVDVLILDEAGSIDGTRALVTQTVAADIARLLGGATKITPGTPGSEARRNLRASDLAVLCRTNKQALGIQLALSQVGVPCVFQGDESVFQSDDAQELERILRALAHPSDAGATRTFLCSFYGGLDAHQLLALEADDAAWDGHRAAFQMLHETWLSHGFMQALRGLVLHYRVEQRLLARPDGPRRITNLWHLVELLAAASVEQRLGPLGLLRWFQIVRQDEARRAELVGEDHELRLESSEDAVKVTTIHKSKGLEYPVVYCPFLWESAEPRANDQEFVRFHDPKADFALTLDLGSADKELHKTLAHGEALAEALRLLYVALTRAKHRICIVLPNGKALGKSALGYCVFGGGAHKELQERVQNLSLDARRQHFFELPRKLQAGWSARTFQSPAETPRYQPRSERPRDLRARTAKRSLDQVTRVSSFSALVAVRSSAHADLGVDHDAVITSSPEAETGLPSTLTLDDFPRGAAAGQLIHEVLENVDFAASVEELQVSAGLILGARGYAPALAEKLGRGLHEGLHTPLAPGLTLAQLRPEARVHEMEFVFPVIEALTPRSLENVFRTHAAPVARPEYAAELRDLAFDALKGLLRGFVDLVFEHAGRFYVVDYKSNRLGPRAEDYTQPALARAMAEHHYFLQYHLYTLALHRYLALRVRDYAYDRHFGGIYYLFLRGMAPQHPAGTGVFFDRPSEALIAALDAAVGAAATLRGASS